LLGTLLRFWMIGLITAEIRFLTIGMLDGRAVAVAHTETDEVIRIISVRKASKNEKEIYYTEGGD
jgi:uncharacterized protein